MEKAGLRKRSLTITIGLVSVAVIGGALAFYHAQLSIENKLLTNKYGGEQMIEKFTPKDDWGPGEEIPKEVFMENIGTAKLFVRVKLDEKWVREGERFINLNSSSGENQFSNVKFMNGSGQISASDGETMQDGSVVKKELGSDKWVYSSKDGYWYYDDILQPAGKAGARTENFLENITLASDADMGVLEELKYYTTMEEVPPYDDITFDETTGWMPFYSIVPDEATYSRSISALDLEKAGYANANYSLTITYETYQATKEARAEMVKTTGANWDVEKVPKLD